MLLLVLIHSQQLLLSMHSLECSEKMSRQPDTWILSPCVDLGTCDEMSTARICAYDAGLNLGAMLEEIRTH